MFNSSSNSTGTSNNQKPSSGRQSSQSLNGPTDARPGIPQDANSSGSNRKELLEERQATIPNAVSRVQAVKPNDSQPYSASLASNSSVVGVYSSSSDPVHVPSPDSRSSAIVGAIKREVGVVGVRRQSTENSVKHSSAPSSSLPSSLLGRENSPSTEPFRPFNAIPKSDQPRQTTVPDHVIPSMPVNRSFLGNQYGSRPHQQPVGHQKGMLTMNFYVTEVVIEYDNMPTSDGFGNTVFKSLIFQLFIRLEIGFLFLFLS